MTQHDLILTYLKKFHTITPYEAFKDLGITKLATRISEMKQLGYKFYDSWVEDVNRFGEPVRYKKYILLSRPRTWTEDELTTLPKETFMLRFGVADEEWEQLQKEFQEM